jgi:acylphosphatase
LNTDITVDVNSLPRDHLLIIVSAVLIFVAIVFFNGFSIRLGEKEVNIGGILRLLEKRDKDTLLKESLKKYTDDVDHEITANLYDFIEELEDNLEPPLAIKEHCFFTYEKFTSIVKSELYKRIRRNNLWEKLSEYSREKYITTILRDIEKRYGLLREKANTVKCRDTYEDFAGIKEAIRGVLNKYFDGTIEILLAGMEKKIEKYEKTKAEFKTAAARKFCCDDCIAKNQLRIKKIAGKTVTAKGEKK